MNWLVDIVALALEWIARRLGVVVDLRGLVVADEEIMSDLEYGRG